MSSIMGRLSQNFVTGAGLTLCAKIRCTMKKEILAHGDGTRDSGAKQLDVTSTKYTLLQTQTKNMAGMAKILMVQVHEIGAEIWAGFVDSGAEFLKFGAER